MLTKGAVFSDHMVLQRRKPIPVWGTGKPGAEVLVSLGTEEKQTTVTPSGRWSVQLDPRDAGGPEMLTIRSEEETLRCEDVVFGEVWLAGGQSNMEMPLQDSKDGKREIAGSGGKNIRFYNVPKCAVLDEEQIQREAESIWRICSPETSGEISAVAWFFALQIAATQNVPVGIIDCYWGGSSISCWMSRGQLEKGRAGQQYLDHYAALVGDKTDEEYRQEMEAYNAVYQNWRRKMEELQAQNPRMSQEELNERCGPCPWPQPAGNSSPFRPAGIYETMIQRICPYGIRGFLYYQGEEDEARHSTYGEMMVLLIDQWRSDWGDMELPFLFVQLPMYCSQEAYARHEDDKHWAALRDQQWKVSRTVANTGLAVLIDCGEFDNIHPLDKRPVGVRLALQARQKVYGESVVADGPRVQAIRKLGNRLEIRFDQTAGALRVKGDVLEGFELAGADGAYYEAKGTAHLNTVQLWSEDVPMPETVRYAWTNYGPANLYNAAGLPAPPFRTDNQPIV